MKRKRRAKWWKIREIDNGIIITNEFGWEIYSRSWKGACKFVEHDSAKKYKENKYPYDRGTE